MKGKEECHIVDLSWKNVNVENIRTAFKKFCGINTSNFDPEHEATVVEMLYKELGYAFRKLKNWSYYLITSFEDFEKEFGQDAQRKRKLYNGMLKTNLYQYPGPKPPRKND
jgi:23S rRNA G2445 N2-methylase RlmL